MPGVPLVQLARRVQEARPVPEGDRQAGAIPDRQPQTLQGGIGRRLRGEPGLHAEVAAHLPLSRSRGEKGRQRLFQAGILRAGPEDPQVPVHQGGLLGGQGAAAAPGFRHLPGQPLGRLDVRLVVRVDPEQVAGDDSGDFPDDELPGDVEGIVDIEGDHRVPRGGKGLQPAVEGGVPGQPHAHEQPVVCVVLRVRQSFPVDREDPLALLAGAFGDQLFDPGPQRRHCGGGGQGQLVAAGKGAAGDGGPEKETGVVLLEPALLQRFKPPLQQALGVDAGETRRHHPEERKRRVAPPDVGVVEE